MTAELMKSKFLRPPTVSQLSLNLTDFFRILVVWLLPLGHTLGRFWILKNWEHLLWIFFVFVNMGPSANENATPPTNRSRKLSVGLQRSEFQILIATHCNSATSPLTVLVTDSLHTPYIRVVVVVVVGGSWGGGGGSLPRLLKGLWCMTFWILWQLFFFFFFFFAIQHGCEGDYKMCDILMRAGLRGKRKKKLGPQAHCTGHCMPTWKDKMWQ